MKPVYKESDLHQWSHPQKKPLLRRALVCEVLTPLLRVATSDADHNIRIHVLNELNNPSLDPDMCEKTHINMLLVAVNDEWTPIRRVAFSRSSV